MSVKSDYICANVSINSDFIAESCGLMPLTKKGCDKMDTILQGDLTEAKKLIALKSLVTSTTNRKVIDDDGVKAVVTAYETIVLREKEVNLMDQCWERDRPKTKSQCRKIMDTCLIEGTQCPKDIEERYILLMKLETEKKAEKALQKVATATETETTTPVTPIAESTTEELVTRLEVAREKATSL
jgi:hypothetical protein